MLHYDLKRSVYHVQFVGKFVSEPKLNKKIWLIGWKIFTLYMSRNLLVLKYKWESSGVINGIRDSELEDKGSYHDDVIKWKHIARYWSFVMGIHRLPVDSPHKGQWHRALVLSLICIWINDKANNRDTGGLRRHLAHYDVTVMWDLAVTDERSTASSHVWHSHKYYTIQE